MAAPITHLVFAHALTDYCQITNQNQFLVGTSFPDIRYLGIIKRETTHPDVLAADLVNQQTDFDKGRVLHLLVDVIGEQYRQKLNTYQYVTDSLYRPNALKFVEDVILHQQITSWQPIAQSLDKVLDQEKAYKLSENDLQRWHHLIQAYCQQPTAESRQVFIISTNRTPPIASDIHNLVENALKNPNLKASILNWFNQVQQAIIQSSTQPQNQ